MGPARLREVRAVVGPAPSELQPRPVRRGVASIVERLPVSAHAVPLTHLGLGQAMMRALEGAGLRTLGDLSHVTDDRLLQLPSIGHGKLVKLHETLAMIARRLDTSERESTAESTGGTSSDGRSSGAEREITLASLGLPPGMLQGLEGAGLRVIGDVEKVADDFLLGLSAVGAQKVAKLRKLIENIRLRNCSSPQALPEAALRIGIDELEGFSQRTLNTLHNSHCRTIGDVVQRMALNAIPRLGRVGRKEIRSRLERFSSAIAALTELPQDPDSILVKLHLQRPFAEEMRTRLASLSRQERFIVERRWLSSVGDVTLGALGTRLRVARNRVRQLQANALSALGRGGSFVRFADARIDAVRSRGALVDLAALEHEDDWFTGVSSDPLWTDGVLAALGSRYRVLAGAPDDLAAVVPSSVADFPKLLRRIDSQLRYSKIALGRRDLARKFLDKNGAPELLSCVMNRQLVGTPRTPTASVLQVLADAEGPLHVMELVRRLEQSGQQISQRVVHAVLIKERVPRPSSWTYVHPARMARGTADLQRAGSDVLALLREFPDKQWDIDEIVEVLAQRGVPWANPMPDLHRVAHALRNVDELVDLGRDTWILCGKPTKRLKVSEVLHRILAEAGAPLPAQELLERARLVRSVKRLPGQVAWPLVQLQGELVGLCERDLGISGEAFSNLRMAVRRELARPPAWIPEKRLRYLGRRHCPGMLDVHPKDLACLLYNSDPYIHSDRVRGGVYRPSPGSRSLDHAVIRGIEGLTGEQFYAFLENQREGRDIEPLRIALRHHLGVQLPEEYLSALLETAGWVEEAGKWYRPHPHLQSTTETVPEV